MSGLIDRGAVATAVTIAALCALFTGGIDLAFEQARHALEDRRDDQRAARRKARRASADGGPK